ncbi:acyl-CoA carboxylase subunit beta [Corynebacterium riegelii]|uniref:acyl-CoA carboxylase subunit beta n=1 Tax=Corynebacterium riegelii TaxID=156976 RepID=UPI002889CB89|nr:carboxyl transferase domain-containing protein [Corynebacterium riegelii]
MTSKPDLTTTAGRIQDLRDRLAEAQVPAGQEAIDAVRESGSATARERVELLLDSGTFVETDALARHRIEAYKMYRTKPATDGVVTGYGLVHGRRVFVFSQDSSLFDGAMGEVYAEKILKLYELATKTGVPVIGIYDSVGPRFQEGIVTAHMQAKILRAAAQASGLVPQIAVVAGDTASLPATTVPLADFVVQVAGASFDGGEAHLTVDTDAAAIAQVRDLLAFLPLNNVAASPLGTEAEKASELDLDTFMPDDDSQDYDVREIINAVTDGDFFELGAQTAGSVLTGLAHIGGRAVGVVATQPQVDGGTLTGAAARKAARFIRTCDGFNLPLVQFVDCADAVIPAGEDAPLSGAAALAYAFAEAQVGTVTVITRKALGTAYALLGSKGLGADLVFAWPTAQIALADAATAAEAIGTDVAEYEAENLNPYVATERGLVDAVIEPSQTRTQVLEGLRLLERKVVYPPVKKHGNMPL